MLVVTRVLDWVNRGDVKLHFAIVFRDKLVSNEVSEQRAHHCVFCKVGVEILTASKSICFATDAKTQVSSQFDGRYKSSRT